MILKDYVKCERIPWVTYFLIAINVVVAIIVAYVDFEGSWIYREFGTTPRDLNFTNFYVLFTSMFLHVGLLHLFGNMLFLWIFADNVEDNLGKLKFILFYFICGISADVLDVFININSDIPAVGASGAISGMMGAYLVLFPQAKLRYVPLNFLVALALFFPNFLEELIKKLKRFWINVPAYVFLFIWIVMQLNAAFSGGSLGIAIWAHIGGFFAGLIGMKILMKGKERKGIVEDVPY